MGNSQTTEPQTFYQQKKAQENIPVFHRKSASVKINKKQLVEPDISQEESFNLKDSQIIWNNELRTEHNFYAQSIRNFLQYDHYQQQDVPQDHFEKFDDRVPQLYQKKQIQNQQQQIQNFQKQNQNFQKNTQLGRWENQNIRQTNTLKEVYKQIKVSQKSEQINNIALKNYKNERLKNRYSQQTSKPDVNQDQKQKDNKENILDQYKSAPTTKKRISLISILDNQKNSIKDMRDFTKNKYEQLPEVLLRRKDQEKTESKLKFIQERREKVKQLDRRAKSLLKK